MGLEQKKKRCTLAQGFLPGWSWVEKISFFVVFSAQNPNEYRRINEIEREREREREISTDERMGAGSEKQVEMSASELSSASLPT